MLFKIPQLAELVETLEGPLEKCAVHSKHLEIYCKECEVWVCVNCIPTHRTHTLQVIDEKFSELKVRIEEIVGKIEVKEGHLDEYFQQVRSTYLIREF